MASTTRIGARGEKGDATVSSHPLRKMIRHKVEVKVEAEVETIGTRVGRGRGRDCARLI